MIELLAICAGGAILVSIVGDFIADGPGQLAFLVTRLTKRYGAVNVITAGPEQCKRAALDSWLLQHAGTTNISPEDRQLFEEQLELLGWKDKG